MLLDLSRQIFNDLQKVADKTREGFSQTQIQTVIQNALAKQGLVTREEFDVQQAVLLRTRERLEALEVQVKALEEAVAAQGSGAATE